MDESQEKHICFLRHAKSSWKYPDLHDYDRPLNDRGLEDAPLMGKKLKKLGYHPDLIISSPANRAISTARIVCEKLDYQLHKLKLDEKIYLASAWQLIDMIKQLDHKLSRVMFIGHEPAFSQTIRILCDINIEKFPTCSAMNIGLNVSNWAQLKEQQGRILFFEYPKKK
ncbi:MAG: SixA phosphatase family protein [Flavobacteriales bacterium]